MTRDPEIWAVAAAADRFSVAARESLADWAASTQTPRPDRATLITCHRVESYGVGDAPDVPRIGSLVAGDGVDEAAGPRPVVIRGDAAVRHLIAVSVGLDSAVLGEDQVLHQVRLALADLCDRRGDPRLVRLFETAVAAGRRIRANHPAGDRNLSELAVRWLERRIGPLRGSHVVVAGAGRMGRAAGAALARRRATITIASRSVERARDAAARVGGTASDLADGARLASRGAGAIVALRGPWLQLSPGIAIPVVDLSFPLSVRADARASLGDSFADVDRIFREAASLQTDNEASRDFRTDAAAIVDQAVRAYRAWSAGRASVSTLRALRDRSEEQRAAELSRLLRRLPGLEPRERELVEAFSERLIASLLHGPTVALREDIDGSAARAAERLFGL